MQSNKKTVSAKVDPDTVDEIDQFCEEHNIRKSEGIRRLIRTGLEDSPNAFSLPVFLLWVGSVAFFTTYADASGIIGPAGAGAIVVGAVLLHSDIMERVSDARARYTSENEESADASASD